MGWERGYYYRAKKVAGRVVRQYLGAGPAAVQAALADAFRRELRQLQLAQRRRESAGLQAQANAVRAFLRRTELLARAALLAAGYRQHKRGEWRKKRG
jgi:hypothetical protein